MLTAFAPRKLCVDVVHNCVADVFFEVPDAAPAPRSVFLQIGRFTPTKNHSLVLEALARLTPDERLRIAVWFAGAGETEVQVRADARRLGLTSEEVKFLGYVPHDRIPEVMSLAHFGLFPSISEGFGIGAAECLAAGRPVLALQTDVMQEVLGPGGICVAPERLDDGFRAMIATGERLRSEARQWATRYHAEHVRSQYVALYRTAIERAR
jgi:glycosyltransferase involved in cell wall biosynthesis